MVVLRESTRFLLQNHAPNIFADKAIAADIFESLEALECLKTATGDPENPIVKRAIQDKAATKREFEERILHIQSQLAPAEQKLLASSMRTSEPRQMLEDAAQEVEDAEATLAAAQQVVKDAEIALAEAVEHYEEVSEQYAEADMEVEADREAYESCKATLDSLTYEKSRLNFFLQSDLQSQYLFVILPVEDVSVINVPHHLHSVLCLGPDL
jgi:chromosome segregation ATPase